MNPRPQDPADPLTDALFPAGEASRRALGAALRESRRRQLWRRAPVGIRAAAAAAVVATLLVVVGPGGVGRDSGHPVAGGSSAAMAVEPSAIAIVTTAGSGRDAAPVSVSVSTEWSQVCFASVATNDAAVEEISDEDLLALAAAPGRPAALVAEQGGFVLVSAKGPQPTGTNH